MKVKIQVLIIIAFGFFISNSIAQPYVKNVIVLNEGHYDYTNSIQTVPVSVGSYDPITQQYTTFDVINNARFASCVVVDGNNIYVAADSFLIKYDRYTHARLDSQIVQGIRKIAVWNNQLLITRGQYLISYNSYFQVYDKNSLAFLYEFNTTVGPQYASEGIVVNNDTAYLAINNGFDYGNEVGYIGKVNLNAASYIGNVDLGPTAKNPFTIAYNGGSLYTVNNRDYTNASVSTMNIANGTLTTSDLATSSGCGASTLATNYIYYQVSGDTIIRRFDINTLTNYDIQHINKNIYGMVHDPINSIIYAGETDYTTYGKIFIYDMNGNVQGSFNVSVAPGEVALDIRNDAGISNITQNSNIFIFPNPAKDQICISNSTPIQNSTIIITDMMGKTVSQIAGSNTTLQTISVLNLSAGIYTIKVISDKMVTTQKFIKQ